MDVDNKYHVTGKLEDIDMRVRDFKPYFLTKTTKEKLESQMQFLEKFAGQSYVNKILSEGLQIPVPDLIISTMDQPRVTAYDGYIIFDSEPKVYKET